MRASGRPSYPAEDGQPIYARAVLESAKITEHYVFWQEISRNPRWEMPEMPRGKIRLTLPYDGYAYFTTRAYADVTRVYGRVQGDASALVGHLALTGYRQTDLDALENLSETHGSIAIRVPLPASHGSGGPDGLIADRSTRVFRRAYTPNVDRAKIMPVNVHVELLDPDSSGWREHVGEAGTVEEIMQQVGFRAELLLRMTVTLYAQTKAEPAMPPEVARVRLDWPTITSVRTLSLTVNGEEHPVRYNPKDRRLEWSNVPMTLVPGEPVGEMHTYTSGSMDLWIPQPGELYDATSLDGSVEVKMDSLLSGMAARLYDAFGYLQRRPRLELNTHVTTRFTLILGDAFARRALSQYQHIQFDDVIPSDMRISDIKVALSNRGFRVTDLGPEGDVQSRWLRAVRLEGPDTMQLYLYVQGIPYKARRDSRVPGGVRYRSDTDSGEIRVYVRGQLPGKSQPVIHEMNALRRALREIFEHLPARR